jgi:hypothetical protein
MNINLKELALIKIKRDLYDQLWEQKKKELMTEMNTKNETTATDPDGILKIDLTQSGKREFSIKGVREVFGEKSKICIVEKVDTKKFDALAKDGKKYIINEEEQKKCFSVDSTQSLNWSGLDVYQAQLTKVAENAK